MLPDLGALLATAGPLLAGGVGPRFVSLQLVSRGGQGVVYRATDVQAGGQAVAIKFLPIEGVDTRTLKNLKAEVLNHRKLQHPHVVQFREVFRVPGYACIVMEYVAGGRLLDMLAGPTPKHFKEKGARWFFQQLVIAMDYCHRRGVVVRDLKLENTLVHKTPLNLIIKICDFGLSKALGGLASEPKTRCGTVSYMAPEVMTCPDGQSYDGKAADVWSLGVMLYAMLYGRFPFRPAGTHVGGPATPKDRDDERQRIVAGRFELPALPGASATGTDEDTGVRNLLLRLLKKDPKKRATIPQVLEHPWVCKDLPPDARSNNDTYLRNPNFAGVQEEQDINAVLEGQGA